MLTSEEIQKQIDEYLAKGGKITHLPYLMRSDFDDFANFASLNHDAAVKYKQRGEKMKRGRKK